MIDFSKFEEKTKGGYDWEIIVPEDGLIRAVNGADKIYVIVSEDGSAVTWSSAFRSSAVLSWFDLVPREEEWRAGWRPKDDDQYWVVNNSGALNKVFYASDIEDSHRAAIGNCYPDTPRGKLLAEARAKYEPLIGEIAGMDEPEEVFKFLRLQIGTPSSAYSYPAELVEAGRKEGCGGFLAAIRWLDSGYRLTIEEDES